MKNDYPNDRRDRDLRDGMDDGYQRRATADRDEYDRADRDYRRSAMEPDTRSPDEPDPRDRDRDLHSKPDRTEYPAVTRGETVRDLMAKWTPARFAFTASREVCGYLLIILIAAILTVAFSLVLFIGGRDQFFYGSDRVPSSSVSGGVAANDGNRPYADGASGNVLLPWADQVNIIPADKIVATNAALADVSTGEIIASRKADEIIYPASMTKVMTLIVVVENLPDKDCLKDTITVSSQVYEEMRRQGSSGIGMKAGYEMSVESMIYALILQSDGVAACELARYVAGSEEDFVELMNQKAEKMGLSNTHFKNPTGLHHPDHKSTSREIASIMAYAMNMQFCRRILMTQKFSASCTTDTGEKMTYNLYHNLLVTQFDKITPNKPNGLKVVAGKTGFTDEGRYCLVTYAEAPDGHGYVCVTAKGGSYRDCVSDYLTIYNTYVR